LSSHGERLQQAAIGPTISQAEPASSNVTVQVSSNKKAADTPGAEKKPADIPGTERLPMEKELARLATELQNLHEETGRLRKGLDRLVNIAEVGNRSFLTGKMSGELGTGKEKEAGPSGINGSRQDNIVDQPLWLQERLLGAVETLLWEMRAGSFLTGQGSQISTQPVVSIKKEAESDFSVKEAAHLNKMEMGSSNMMHVLRTKPGETVHLNAAGSYNFADKAAAANEEDRTLRGGNTTITNLGQMQEMTGNFGAELQSQQRRHMRMDANTARAVDPQPSGDGSVELTTSQTGNSTRPNITLSFQNQHEMNFFGKSGASASGIGNAVIETTTLPDSKNQNFTSNHISTDEYLIHNIPAHNYNDPGLVCREFNDLRKRSSVHIPAFAPNGFSWTEYPALSKIIPEGNQAADLQTILQSSESAVLPLSSISRPRTQILTCTEAPAVVDQHASVEATRYLV
jgi:hypothetical protein